MTLFKYEEICTHYSKAIEKGILKSGEKLLSLRKTALRFGCSLSVALQAYEELERKGYIRSVEKSGFYVLPRKGNDPPRPQDYDFSLKLGESRPSSMIGTIMAMAHRSDFIPFGATIPHISLLPVKKLGAMLSESAKGGSFYMNHYTDRNGEFVLREEVARMMLSRGVFAGPDDIIITNGCTEALYMAIGAVSEAGDGIAIESPAYSGMITILKEQGRRVVEIPTDAERGMDLNRLEEVLSDGKIKAVIVSSEFQNPLGFVMNEEDRRRLYDLSEEYGVYIIEDDIYGDSSFTEKSRRSVKSYDKSGRVIYCSSLSKTLSPGLRIGWMLPGRFLEKLSEVKQVSGLGGTIVVEHAVARYLAEGHYDLHLKSFRKKIAAQTWEIGRLVGEHFPGGTRVSSPKGGYFLWIEMDRRVDSLSLFQWAYDRKIGIIPGPVYSASGKFRNCIRISCGSPLTEEAVSGLQSLGEEVRRMIRQGIS